MRPVVLINPNTNDATTDMMVSVAHKRAPDLRFVGLTAREGPALIVNERQLDQAALQIAAMAGEVAALDPAGVIVSAFGDPGADALAELVSCPVTGIAAASAMAASAFGRFAVATTTPDLVIPIERRISQLGFNRLYCGTYLTGSRDAVSLTNDIERLDVELADAVARAARAGAQAVCIGGGPLSGARDRIAGRTAIPLIDPVCAAVDLVASRMASGSL
ncbi:Asp/Glu/hydantoin racemase [Breoghania corrubedonensis]|uniref:Asp/Glu/hydantoin racemase n=1 Tax=Breoghania corrubedonensis TaxID=665038 RepID=A0A2T5V6D5_9HYPH|nr:aspartate/glutamate racemase family protein [Breoghania corrubedonensis]PTW59318.1 Asp/Glu/hydantoin racemase [Breoghania corrubedonensis]